MGGCPILAASCLTVWRNNYRDDSTESSRYHHWKWSQLVISSIYRKIKVPKNIKNLMENIWILIAFFQVIRIEYYNSLINRNLGAKSFMYCWLYIFFILIVVFPFLKKERKKIAKERRPWQGAISFNKGGKIQFRINSCQANVLSNIFLSNVKLSGTGVYKSTWKQHNLPRFNYFNTNI